MRFLGGIRLNEGTDVKNMSLPLGPIFPDSPNVGELFYIKDGIDTKDGIYVCDFTDTQQLTWRLLVKIEEGDELFPVVEVGSTEQLSLYNITEAPLRWNFQSRINSSYFEHDKENSEQSSKLRILRSGLYEVSYVLNTVLEKKGEQMFRAGIQVNGQNLIGRSVTNTLAQNSDKPATNTTTFLARFDANDYIELVCSIDSLKNQKLRVLTISANCALSLRRIGDI